LYDMSLDSALPNVICSMLSNAIRSSFAIGAIKMISQHRFHGFVGLE
jgi:hypothetical protein